MCCYKGLDCSMSLHMFKINKAMVYCNSKRTQFLTYSYIWKLWNWCWILNHLSHSWEISVWTNTCMFCLCILTNLNSHPLYIYPKHILACLCFFLSVFHLNSTKEYWSQKVKSLETKRNCIPTSLIPELTVKFSLKQALKLHILEQVIFCGKQKVYIPWIYIYKILNI